MFESNDEPALQALGLWQAEHCFDFSPLVFGGHRQIALENLALRHQLAVYKRAGIRPRLRRIDRLFWVALARIWTGWRQPLLIVTPTPSCGAAPPVL